MLYPGLGSFDTPRVPDLRNSWKSTLDSPIANNNVDTRANLSKQFPISGVFYKKFPLLKYPFFVNDKISDENKSKISNVLKRPKKSFRGPEINEISPLLMTICQQGAHFYLKKTHWSESLIAISIVSPKIRSTPTDIATLDDGNCWIPRSVYF